MTPPSRVRRSRPAGMVRRAIPVLAAVAVLAAGLAWSLADQGGWERLPIVAGLVGPRNAVTVVLAVFGLAATVLAVLRRSLRRLLAPTAAAALVVACVSGSVVVARGLRDESPTSGGTTLRILSWNTNGDLVTPAAVAALAAREHADVLVLPEIAAATTGRRYAPALAAAGLRMRPYPAIDRRAAETVVFVRDGLRYGSAVGRSGVPDTSAALTPLAPDLPAIVALHASQPTFRDNAQWQRDLEWVADRCRDPRTVAVGDFNATVDSFGSDALGGCRDAAAQRAAASVGTWPTRMPSWAGMPLDHVLVGADWRVRSFTVIRDQDGSGARHRPILAVIERIS